ncbi:hypothetical protein Bbelb_223880 [Branchiostoma belcheri]|nr:hypothetical protein Bbelb_223880 [Branchiostoma belcheri]
MEGNDRQQANKDNITRPTNLENTTATSSANVVRTVEPQTMFASAERLSKTSFTASGGTTSAFGRDTGTKQNSKKTIALFTRNRLNRDSGYLGGILTWSRQRRVFRPNADVVPPEAVKLVLEAKISQFSGRLLQRRTNRLRNVLMLIDSPELVTRQTNSPK